MTVPFLCVSNYNDGAAWGKRFLIPGQAARSCGYLVRIELAVAVKILGQLRNDIHHSSLWVYFPGIADSPR